MNETEYIDLIPVIVAREKAVMPEWCDSWGIKSVHPDLRTTHEYTWPLPGNVAECNPKRLLHRNDSGCPKQVGDGLCVATTWSGMASGGIRALTLLLVAYNSAEVLGSEANGSKLRLPRVAVVKLVDGARLLRDAGADANLRGAHLAGAYLWGAYLRGAYLEGAHLAGAYLWGANLEGAHLEGAYLRGANLEGADLRGANLEGANLRSAYLEGADLRGANLEGANLRSAYLWGARANCWTTWPGSFDWAAAGVVVE